MTQENSLTGLHRDQYSCVQLIDILCSKLLSIYFLPGTRCYGRSLTGKSYEKRKNLTTHMGPQPPSSPQPPVHLEKSS